MFDNNGAEILIVEDSPTQAGELAYTLEKHGYSVTISRNGTEALETIRRRKPSLIVSDIIMPEMDGFTLCRKIKNETDPDIPVILLTALSDTGDVLKGLECGADNFITKPYDGDYLLTIINRILVNAKLRRESKPQKGVEIYFRDKKYLINSERQQILDLLLSTYETAIMKNEELKEAQEKLKEMNEQLEQRVQKRTAELEQRTLQLREMAIEVTQTESRERKRLAAILHDHLQQNLVGAKLFTQMMQSQAINNDLKKSVQKVEELLDESIKVSRSLTIELSPPILHEEGFVQGLRWLAGWMMEKYAFNVDLVANTDITPDAEEVSILLFQSIRELLFNVIKHAGVKEAQVSVSKTGDMLRIIVADRGSGFDATRTRASGTKASFGLFSIRERIDFLGGQMDIDSAIGMGTRVSIIAPLPSRPVQK